ncbi:hypothetical protein BBP40_008863 [Aspergillus hancockii]|nr:hypothetical protein BBP40_008863 [Aspergillus hancockii]
MASPMTLSRHALSPRPIGWISTKNKAGQCNLVPYSQFNNLKFDPPYVMFSSNQTVTGAREDTVVNAEEMGTFVCDLATWDLREAVNITAQQTPYGADEFEPCNITKERATLVDIPMVKESPVKFECEYHTTVRLQGNPTMETVDIVIGKVIGVHIAEKVLTNCLLDVKKTQPIACCGTTSMLLSGIPLR